MKTTNSDDTARDDTDPKPSSDVATVMTLERPRPGNRLAERYELVAEIGRGGMGIIYRAKDLVLGRDVAIKMIPSDFFDDGERFRREARTLAQLDHPAILPIHDFGEFQGSLFLVMPLVEGSSLHIWIREHRLQLGQTLDIAVQMAEALDYSHSRGVVHRDVKPENVMLTENRRVLRARVMDFGLAREISSTRLTHSGSFIGTLAYMSPEQVGEREVDGRVDLYALGMVLYECLCGEPAFSGTAEAMVYRIAHEHPQPLRDRGAAISEELDALVLSCLAKDPANRPASGEVLSEALKQLAAELRDEERSRSVRLISQAASRLRPRPTLVGRKAELAELQARLNAAVAGECQLVLVEGDAGSGKSRLLEELEQLATVRRLRVLHGRFSDRQSAMLYQGFCEVIQDYFRTCDEAGSPSTPDLSDLAPDLQAIFPVFSEIEALRVRASGEAVEVVTRKETATYIFELFARTLTRLADGRPLVVLLENLHAGEVSLEALEYIVHRLGPTPTLFVGTCRPARAGHALHYLREGFEGDPRFCRLVLPPLNAEEIRQLIALEIASDEIDVDAVERLLQATEGNPFFTRELVRSLVESEDLRRDTSGLWRLRRKFGVTRDALPETVQEAVKKRLQRLDESRRRVLAVASVLGRSFEYEDLEALLVGDDDEDLDALIDALLEEELLEEDGRSRGDRLKFSSAVVADVLYRELPRRRRRRLHRQHAERLEKRHAGHLERIYPDLVHHFSEADVAEKTVRYGLELASLSLASFSPEEALLPARTALELIDEEEIPDAVAVRGELLLLVARAERLAGRTEEALFEAERAVHSLVKAKSPRTAAKAALFLAETAWQGWQGDVARRWVERGLELLAVGEEQGTAHESTLHALLILGATLANLRGESAQAHLYLAQAEKLVPAAAPEDEETIPVGGTLVTALPNFVVSLDPARLQSDAEGEVAAMIFENLLRTDEAGALRPLLCETWESSADGKSFELAIRPHVTFSDGQALLAKDVKTSIERYLRHGPPDLTAVFSTLVGFKPFLAGEHGDLEGLEVTGDHRVVFRFDEPLPIFPALLTQPYTAIVKESPSLELLGTGPFVLAQQDAESIRLRRSPTCPSPPRLEQVEFRTALDASGIAAGLRQGVIDLGRDLLPVDLEEILRDPQFRSGLVEATRKNVYFVLFNTFGPITCHAAVRRALAGVIRTQDLVWRTLGRFAQPAVSLIPPGILGHDPGRRRPLLSRDEARSLLQEKVQGKIELRAAIHPLMQDRYGSLTRALEEEWSALGVTIVSQASTIDEYVTMYRGGEVDILIACWIGDYDDPDAFTSLFHSHRGLFQRYYSSGRSDELIDQARQEIDVRARQTLCQRFEDLLDEESVLIPLFHDVNYRIASPKVRGLKLYNVWPYVNYSMVGKQKAGDERPSAVSRSESRGAHGDEIHVPIQDRVDTLDPIAGMFLDYWEVLSNVFETLMLEEDTRIVPGLAGVFEARSGGRDYYVRLRDGVRFHDGRRLTARDVRYSFERVLRSPRADVPFPVLPIRGAQAFRSHEARELAGFHILSATEFLLSLDEPLAFFPALMTSQSVAIVPEGSRSFQTSWRGGCVGTGPFRVVRFERGERIDLERNPEYWRPEMPKSSRLIFHLGVSPERATEDFRQGRLTMVSNLRPADLETMYRTPELMAGYREAPKLSTYFLALNTRQGPFVDAGLRRCFAQAIDIDTAVRKNAGRLTLRASGLIPPGLLGYEAAEPSMAPKMPACEAPEALRGLRLRVLAIPAYGAQYERLWTRLCQMWRDAGIELETVPTSTVAEVTTRITEEGVDLMALRWLADYPDTDGMVGRVLHSDGSYLNKVCSTPETDRLLQAGRREVDPSLRHEIYREIEELIAREVLLIPLFHDQAYRFCQPGVEGLRLTYGSPEVRYEKVELGGARPGC